MHLPTASSPLTLRIIENPKFFPFFDNCIGALNGTHVSVYVLSKDAPQYRNWKGTLSQNVLSVCHFNGTFAYTLPGWEGSANDGRVLQDAQFRHGFKTPAGKYWLGDAGYPNSEFIITPYHGVQYHLRE